MSAVPATTPPTSQHSRWCRQHTPEGCLSDSIQIPDLPFAIWATRQASDPDNVIRIVIDGPSAEHDGTVTIDLTLTGEADT